MSDSPDPPSVSQTELIEHIKTVFSVMPKGKKQGLAISFFVDLFDINSDNAMWEFVEEDAKREVMFKALCSLEDQGFLYSFVTHTPSSKANGWRSFADDIEKPVLGENVRVFFWKGK